MKSIWLPRGNLQAVKHEAQSFTRHLTSLVSDHCIHIFDAVGERWDEEKELKDEMREEREQTRRLNLKRWEEWIREVTVRQPMMISESVMILNMVKQEKFVEI